jgi:WD40 repeat protein
MDGTLRIWDANVGIILSVLNERTGPVTSVAWSPDGTCLAAGYWDTSVRLWGAAEDY